MRRKGAARRRAAHAKKVPCGSISSAATRVPQRPQETVSRVPRVVFPAPPLHCAIFMIRPTMRPLLEECAASRRPTSVSS